MKDFSTSMSAQLEALFDLPSRLSLYPHLQKSHKSSSKPDEIQQSFSLNLSHSYLLEICITYLYFLGKESSYNKTAMKIAAVGAFLSYAAKNWTSHYEHVFEDAPQTEYYYGLCHPMFPGFEILAEASGLTVNKPYGLSPDQLHNFYLDAFGVRVARAKRWVNRHHDPLEVLSSNRATHSNHHFPLEVDKTGFEWLKKSS